MNNALIISGLTKTYKDFVLDNVSFSVPSGSIVGLIGENGAGKSTTINAALGIIQKEDGYVSVFGKDELDNETKEQTSRITGSSPLVASSKISSLEWCERATEIANFIFIPLESCLICLSRGKENCFSSRK